MGILKKSFSHALILSLILGSGSIYAEAKKPKSLTPQKPRTAADKATPFAAFNTQDFCARAPTMLEDLNKENEEKIASLDLIKEEINELESYKDIIVGVDALRQNYESGLREIIKSQIPQSPEEMKKKKYKSLDNMKRVVRDGMILNALGLMLKDSDLDSDESFKMAKFCSKEKEIQPVCKIKPVTWMARITSTHPLDPILQSFRNAYKNVKGQNKLNLKADVQKILDSIPPTIAPSAILSILDNASPGLSSIMAADEAKAALTQCLDENSSEESLKACEKLLPAKGTTTNFMTEINSQTNNAISKLQDFKSVIEESTKANLERFNKEVSSLEIQSQTPAQAIAAVISQNKDRTIAQENQLSSMRISQQEKVNANFRKIANTQEAEIKQAEADSLKLPVIAALFYNKNNLRNANSLGQIKDLNNKDIKDALARSTDWQNKCKNNYLPSNEEFCTSEMSKIKKNVEEMKIDYKSRLQAMKSKMNQINTDDNNNYKKVETMKKYVAEKFIRTCAGGDKFKIKKEEIKLNINYECEAFQSVHTLNAIEGLGNNVDSIMKFAMNISGQADATGTFSKAEVQVFNDVCAADNFAKTHERVCDEIAGERQAREKVKDTKVWDDESNKYYLTYDDSNPKGYSKVAKKSNLRVFGDGVLPVAPQMIPMIFGNYVMKQNINMLTNQALYQKQMLHNFDVYNNNPWMYNYPFFGMGQPGLTFGSTSPVNNTGFGF